jgi:HD-like signal output (HDOD) protein
MRTAKANILKVLTKEYEDKGKFFYDFRLDLEEETAEERAIGSLISAFNAWSNIHWRMNDNLRESISAATKLQKNVRECKEVNSIYLINSYSSVVEQAGKLKEIENGIWQLCNVIGLSIGDTNELFKKVHSFIKFDSLY